MLVIVVVHDEVAGRSRGRFARATQSSPAPSRRWSMADAVGDVSATGSGPSERAVPVDDAGASTPPRDVFSSAEFDAVDFLNRLFPDETSLTGVDALVAKLRLRVRRVDDEILEAVRSQSTGGVRAKADLAQAQTAILELGARIRDIKDKAELSETMVQEICRDIKKLDRAKRHLTGTITALRRLSMLVSAVDQLETMAMRRQYHDSANLLEAVNQLSAHFDGYNDVPKVAELQRKYAKIRAALRANVFEEFHATWQPSVIEQDPGAAPRLADACLVVNALEPHVREELVGNLTNKELTAYAQVFDGSFGEQSNLDAVERRYAWIKRNLKAKEEMWGVFPPHWRVPQLLCMSLCKLTRTHLLEILDAPGPKEVQTTLQALHRTIEFERDMDDYFRVDAGADEGADESADFDAEDGVSAGQVRAKYERLAKEAEVAKQRGGRALPMDSAAAALANASFKGVIASSFEDHMGPYVELEERQLMEFLDALVAEETWGKRADESTEGSSTPARAIPAATHASGATHGEVLASAGQVFLNIKKVFKRCSNLTRGKALFALHGVFSRVIRSYAGKLIDRVELAGKILSDVRGRRDEGEIAGEYRCLCLVINTAEWCKETVGPLGESMRRMLDGNLGDGVDSEATEEEFASLITAAVATLVDGAEARTQLISGVTRVNWGALEVVGDQSAYVDECNAALFAVAPAVRATVRADYHRFFARSSRGRSRRSSIARCSSVGDSQTRARNSFSWTFTPSRRRSTTYRCWAKVRGFDRARVALEAGGEGDGRVRGADESRALANRGTRGDVQGAPPGRIRRGFPRGVRTQGDEKDGSGGGGGRDRAEAHRGRARRRRRRGFESDGRGGGERGGVLVPVQDATARAAEDDDGDGGGDFQPRLGQRFPVDRFLGRRGGRGDAAQAHGVGRSRGHVGDGQPRDEQDVSGHGGGDVQDRVELEHQSHDGEGERGDAKSRGGDEGDGREGGGRDETARETVLNTRDVGARPVPSRRHSPAGSSSRRSLLEDGDRRNVSSEVREGWSSVCSPGRRFFRADVHPSAPRASDAPGRRPRLAAPRSAP